MTPNKRRAIFVVVLAGTVLTPVAAHADLIGSTLSWQYYANGGPFNAAGYVSGGTFVDNGGVGGTFTEPGPNDVFDIDADGASISFNYSDYYSTLGSWSPSSLSLAPTIYNGVAVDLESAGSFTGVTLDGATNMAGFTSANFSFTGNEIQVDWANLDFTTSTIVTLDVTFSGTDAPEPATYGSMALAVLMAGFVRRSRRLS
jgi:hypothetical protein